MNLMDIYQSLKQDSDSQAQLEIARKQIGALDERGSDRVPFLRLRALIQMHTGDLDGAGRDLKEALAINGKDLNTLQLDGDLLMKLGRTEQAIDVYRQILGADPVNRSALISVGYASRTAGRDQDAEKYFHRLAEAYPTLYIPYLALGDLYSSRRDYAKADAAYTKAYALAPKNALIVAGGMNDAIEAHKLDQAALWLGRATPEMQHEPKLLREKERYFSFKGDYAQSAAVGEEVIKMLPGDRDVVVYLGYDLLNLDRYDDLLKLTTQYNGKFPKEPDIPLLAGYVHKHNGQLDLAKQDFTEALNRDPNVVTAYVNRGYVLHDLRESKAAAADFQAALKREPNNGEAHQGLAYASLDLHKPRIALQEVQLAQKILGDSQPIHLIRATAYGQRGMLTKAEAEYRLALKFTPDDPGLHLALAGTLYAQRRYHETIDELQTAVKLAPDSAATYALLARTYAQLKDRDQTLHYVQLAEQHAVAKPAKASEMASGQSEIFVSTGEALSMLGDQSAAMDRFGKALAAPESDRMSVRLAIADLMAHQGRQDDASRQVALGVMEAEAGETLPPTGEQLVAAADVFRDVHDFQLSDTYLLQAKAADAPDSAVKVGLADNYLALGDTVKAQGELSSIGTDADDEPGYQYLLAEANVYRQEHQSTQALTAFAQASNAAGEDQTAEQSLLEAGADEGLRVRPRVSVLSDFAIEPIFEDSTVYVLDAKLDGPVPVLDTQTALLPPPRSSLETEWTGAFHLHLNNLPTASGFFQVRNARGLISVPSTNSIVNRDTTDYTVNFGLNPTIHLGTNVLTFDSGIQGTLRRDSKQPVQLDQNLFRAFTYVSTSSFFNVVSASGSVLWEAGPFTNINEHSRAAAGAIDFRVGEPWGKNTLVTGWGVNDQTFSPVGIENFYTSSYLGIERRFSTKLDVKLVAEDLRAWRVVESKSGIAQDLRPAGTVNFAPNHKWNFQASSAYSSTRSFHVYDSIHNGFAVSYAMPFHRNFKDEHGEVPLEYPIRFSAGLQQETFFNFSGQHNEQLRPYFSISLF
jgi:tetratricopeptide (TPR) repeat protein